MKTITKAVLFLKMEPTYTRVPANKKPNVAEMISYSSSRHGKTKNSDELSEALDSGDPTLAFVIKN